MTRRWIFPAALAALAVALLAWAVLGRGRTLGRVENVVLISIDTCRADRLGCYGRTPATTPHIDGLAREGVLFLDALTPIPLTTPAHASMLTGTYPPFHGVRLNNGARLPQASVTMAEALRGAGFQTAAFVGGFPLDPGFGLAQGFDTYDARFTRRGATSATQAERSAEEVATPALAWLDGHAGRRFFLFLHFFDPHLPYAPPPPYDASFPGDAYSGEIAYVDAWIGRVLDKLRALRVDDDTLIVIVGDHGESLGEHGEKSHGFFVYRSTQHVPLVIRAPRGPRGLRLPDRVGLVDLMPTVLDLANVASPPPTQGISLRRMMEGRGRAPSRALYAESLVATQFDCSALDAVVEGPWKYIRAPRPELYDLSKDPGEQHDLAATEPRVARGLRDRLEAMERELSVDAVPQEGSAADPEAAARLQALGYVGGPTRGTRGPEPSLEDPKDFIALYEKLEEANAHFHSNRATDAERELLQIVAARPRLVAAEDLLARIALRERRPDDAASHYRRIVTILEERKAASDLPSAHFNLAFALREAGRDEAAIAEYERALASAPDYVEAHNSLGLALLRAGRVKDAVAHFERAIRIDPAHAQAHNNLGSAFETVGRLDDAIAQYERAIALKPDYVGALSRLAWIRATSVDAARRNGTEAVALAERAVGVTGRGAPGPLDVLAAAYAEASRFDEAIATAREAEEVARRSGQAPLALEIDRRRGLYERRRPYRPSP